MAKLARFEGIDHQFQKHPTVADAENGQEDLSRAAAWMSDFVKFSAGERDQHAREVSVAGLLHVAEQEGKGSSAEGNQFSVGGVRNERGGGREESGLFAPGRKHLYGRQVTWPSTSRSYSLIVSVIVRRIVGMVAAISRSSTVFRAIRT
jgi:hypothetical protein